MPMSDVFQNNRFKVTAKKHVISQGYYIIKPHSAALEFEVAGSIPANDHFSNDHTISKPLFNVV